MLAGLCLPLGFVAPSPRASRAASLALRSRRPVLEATGDALSDDAIRQKLKSLGSKPRRPRPGSAPIAAPPPPPPPPPKAKAKAKAKAVEEEESDLPPPMERLRSKVASRATAGAPLDDRAASAVVSFLNEQLGEEMLDWVMRATEVGKTASRKNMWSNGAWVPKAAVLESLTPTALRFGVRIAERGKPEPLVLTTELPLRRACATVDELRDELLRLTLGGADARGARGAGALVLRLPGASDDWSLPDDLWLNTTPYPRSVRNMFYADVLQAVQAAVADPSCPRLMQVNVSPPELNMEMDSYRVGSLLELVREVALGFADAGLRTRVCVQGSMGEGAFMGVPRVLSGVRKVMTMMDWQAEAGEDYEGLLGRSEAGAGDADAEGGGSEDDDEGGDAAEGLVRFGAVGAAEVAPDDDVLIVLAPQSMVGASIYPSLKAMADAATARGAALVLINPLLEDVQSSSGVMGVRGRSERIAFAASFERVYGFRNVYSGTTFMFPILGALRMTRRAAVAGGDGGDGGGGGGGGDGDGSQASHHVLFQRREAGGSERYEPVGCWLGREPTAKELTALVSKQLLGDGVTSAPSGAGAVEEAETERAKDVAKISSVAAAAKAAKEVERMPWD